jgi:hypothetical protein
VLKLLAGSHVYVEAPAAVIVADVAEQTVGLNTVTTGFKFTITESVTVNEQVPCVPVTVYTVVVEGLAFTVSLLVVFKPLEGVHV